MIELITVFISGCLFGTIVSMFLCARDRRTEWEQRADEEAENAKLD